jgi:hypothetical protein
VLADAGVENVARTRSSTRRRGSSLSRRCFRCSLAGCS